MSIQPLRDFILVSKQAEEEKPKDSLIFRPATADTKIVKATVLAVGSGALANDGKAIPLEVKVGDTVVFNKNLAQEITDGSDTALIIREDQLLAVVR